MGKRNTERERDAASPELYEPHVSAFRELSLLGKAETGHDVELGVPPHYHPGFPDSVYLHAAAVFQASHVEKPTSHRLISYGGKASFPMMPAEGKTSQLCAYKLAFNTLKYQELLEDMMIDSCFYLSQPMPEDLMSLVAVMLYDFQDRRFMPREESSCEAEEYVEDVRRVESCLYRFRTKLAASLARCRIKRDLLTVDRALPECVKKNQDWAACLPLYTWVNTFKARVEDVCSVLTIEGFSRVTSVSCLEGRTFCIDGHCLDVLTFPPQLKSDLYKTKLLSEHKLIIQDKTRGLVVEAVRRVLDQNMDVLVGGPTSACTLARVAAVATPLSGQVLYASGCLSTRQRLELQEELADMECRNVKVMSENFCDIGLSDLHLQKARVVLLVPECSVTAVSDPVEFILDENRDKDLLQDLSRGTIAQNKLAGLVARQVQDVVHALKFPKVQTVMYCTCSSYPEENEEVIRKALMHNLDSSRARPFRLTSPGLPPSAVSDVGNDRESFFKLDQSDECNGCFIAVLTREPAPEETAQEVLARAGARGLLKGMVPGQRPAKKGKHRARKHGMGRHRLGPCQGLSSSQARIEDFLTREAKGSNSTPNLMLLDGLGKNKTQDGMLPWTLLSNSTTSQHLRKEGSKVVLMGSSPAATRAPVPPKPLAPSKAPPRGRQEVLRPVTLLFPPVTFPTFSSMNPKVQRPHPRTVPAWFRWRPNTLLATSISSDSAYDPYLMVQPQPRL